MNEELSDLCAAAPPDDAQDVQEATLHADGHIPWHQHQWAMVAWSGVMLESSGRSFRSEPSRPKPHMELQFVDPLSLRSLTAAQPPSTSPADSSYYTVSQHPSRPPSSATTSSSSSSLALLIPLHVALELPPAPLASIACSLVDANDESFQFGTSLLAYEPSAIETLRSVSWAGLRFIMSLFSPGGSTADDKSFADPEDFPIDYYRETDVNLDVTPGLALIPEADDPLEVPAPPLAPSDLAFQELVSTVIEVMRCVLASIGTRDELGLCCSEYRIRSLLLSIGAEPYTSESIVAVVDQPCGVDTSNPSLCDDYREVDEKLLQESPSADPQLGDLCEDYRVVDENSLQDET